MSCLSGIKILGQANPYVNLHVGLYNFVKGMEETPATRFVIIGCPIN